MSDLQEKGVVPIGPMCAELFGGVSKMWVERKLEDETSGFPKPIYISGRRFWRVAEVLAWIDAQPSEAEPVGKAAMMAAEAATKRRAAA
jgi:predicted DNA-binding transcriptional regulator AlpA